MSIFVGNCFFVLTSSANFVFILLSTLLHLHIGLVSFAEFAGYFFLLFEPELWREVVASVQFVLHQHGWNGAMV